MIQKRRIAMCLLVATCTALYAADWQFTVTAANLYARMYKPFDASQEPGGSPVVDVIEFAWEERGTGLGVILSPCDMQFVPGFAASLLNATVYWNALRSDTLILGPYVQGNYLVPGAWNRFCVEGGLMLKLHGPSGLFGNERHHVTWTNIRAGVCLTECGWAFTLGIGADVAAMAKGFLVLVELLAPVTPLLPDD